MAVIHKNGQIILTENDGKSFSKKMNGTNAFVARKRDAFIRDAKESCYAIHKSNGRIALKGK